MNLIGTFGLDRSHMEAVRMCFFIASFAAIHDSGPLPAMEGVRGLFTRVYIPY